MIPKNISSVVYINLPEREDRNKYMKTLLEESPVRFRRMEGIRYNKNPEESGYKILDRLKNEKGYIGIYLAHLNVLRWWRKQSFNGSLMLLEDDVILKEGFWEKNINIESLNDDWDMILISPRYKNRNTSEQVFEKDKKKFKSGFPVNLKEARKKYICTGAHCVIFRNISVANKAFNKLKYSEDIYDVDLFYINNFKAYGIHSNKVSAGGFSSDHH